MKMRLLGALAACLVLFGIIGCAPKNTTAQATPSPTQAAATATQQKILFKQGDEYRVYLYYISKPEDVYTEELRSKEMRTREEAMEAEYGITITFVPFANYWADVRSTAYSGEPMADILYVGGPYLMFPNYYYNQIAGSILEPFDKYPDAGSFQDPEYWSTDIQNASCYFEDKLYFVVPNLIGWEQVFLNNVTYFNKRLLESAGYSAAQMYEWNSTGQWTWERLEEVAVATTNKDAKIYGLSRSSNNAAATNLMHSNGGSQVTRREVDGKMRDVYTGMEDPAVEAWDFVVSLYNQGVMGGTVGDDAAVFKEGKYAIMLSELVRAGQLKEMVDDYGFLQIPKGPRAADYVSNINWFVPYAMFQHTDNPGGTAQLVHEFYKPLYAKSSEENQLLLDQELSDYARDEESVQVCKNTMNYQKYTSFMMYVDGPVGQKILNNTDAEKIYNGEITPSVYFSSIESAVNDLIDQVYSVQNHD